METIGDDKKIRALFSEARLADEQAMPSFIAVWHRAQSRALRPRRAFNLSFAAVTALLVLALGSLAVWSMYSKPRATYSAFADVPAVKSFRAPEVITAGQNPTPTTQKEAVHRPVRSRVTR